MVLADLFCSGFEVAQHYLYQIVPARFAKTVYQKYDVLDPHVPEHELTNPLPDEFPEVNIAGAH